MIKYPSRAGRTRAAGRVRGSALTSLLALVLFSPVACGGGGDAGASSRVPLAEPTGPVDEELAERGEELFRTRGCTACHTLGQGKKVGPDLRGVTERRDFEWTYHMVTNPDSMVKNDPDARQLLNEYLVPMSDQNVSPEQFRAIYEYLRAESRGASESEQEESR